MKIKWTPKALEMLEQTLDYWDSRNKSNNYSKRIIAETELAEIEIADNPYFLSRFFKDIKLYRKSFFNGRFYLYYDIIDEENTVRIKYFRSHYQRPL